MEFNEFREKVKEALPDFLTDDLRNAEIKDTAVNKLQGESYSGISVTPEGSRVGVSINLEDAFLDYQTGSQFTAVMNRLADTIVGTLGERNQFDLGFLADYSAVKNMLTVEVVGKDQNAEMLQSVPHQEMEDLAAVYRIDLGVTENGNATVLITNEMMRNYGLTPDQLHKDALDAAQHTMKYSIRSMDEVLMGMAQSMGVEQDQPVMFSSPLYVATTERDMFGAGVLAVPSFFEDAAEKLDGNFYVLPSSVHEILLLPDRFAPEPQLLKEMVQDVNANEVDMAVVPGKEPRLMSEDEFYKNHTDYDERVQILCASYLTVLLEYNHRKVLTLGEEKYLVGDAALYGYDSEKHEVYIDPDMVEDLLNDIEERTVMPAIRI